MSWILSTWALGAAVLLLIVIGMFWRDPRTTERAGFLAAGAAIAFAWLPLLAAAVPGGLIFLITRPRRDRRGRINRFRPQGV